VTEIGIALPWGRTVFDVRIPKGNLRGVLEAKEPIRARGDADPVAAALRSPVGRWLLSDIVAPGVRTAIVVSDVTRPCPTDQMLPVILEQLSDSGVRDEDVSVIFALGTHRGQTAAEQKRLVGEDLFERLDCRDFDRNDVLSVGETSRGTEVEVSRAVLGADICICLGNIDFHYFAGYTGGLKAVMPGVCSEATIRQNHRLMFMPGSVGGRLEGNPVREDIEEAGTLIGVDFVLNVVLDEDFEIVGAVAGDPLSAHRAGCKLLDELYKIELRGPADVVLVSAGGYPKDINLYQAQKALWNAARAVKDGGVIVLLAECAEGWGHDTFESWLLSGDTPEILRERAEEDFVLGGHKAVSVAETADRASIYLVSALDAGTCQWAGLRHFDDPQSAVNAALDATGPAADVLVMPHGAATLPVVASN